MKRKNDEQGIECKTPIVLKLLVIGFTLFIGIIFRWWNQPSEPFFWLFWILLGLLAFASGTNVLFYNEGIEVHIWWLHTFVEWDNVRSAHYEGNKTRVYVKKVTPPSFIMKTFANFALGISRWDTNYELVVDILEERLGKRFLEGIGRKRKANAPSDPPE
jgi:hypothetical protein